MPPRTVSMQFLNDVNAAAAFNENDQGGNLMKIKLHAQLHHTGQDGALWGDLLFRFNANAHCCVFDAAALDTAADAPVTLPRIAEFWVGKN